MTRRFLTTALYLCLASSAFAQSPAEYRVPRASEPPKLDGILDDQVWAQAPMPTGQWVWYNPNRGDKMPDVYKTDVRIAYDDRNLYFAFHCFDNEPGKIRTNIAKRDAAFSDDWIALSLDSAGTGQAAYHLFSNPSASQMDALNTSASGEQFDADMVWFSAAKMTSDGYVVEVQIPLQTLRFSGGDEVKMNLVFFRKVSRIGYSYAWPEMLPGQWVFDRPSRLIFSNLKPRRLVELLPSVTYGINQQRETANTWGPADDKYNVGASGKLGITSGITLDGTINPDFSQVESDAFQVQVNQRFPLFFSEKRPFFMEGMGLFNIAGTGGDGNMRTAVHTRRIVDPIYGSKLTGTIGKTAFGVLNAVDDSPTPPFTIEGEPFDVPNKVTTVGRATYGLRRSDYVGGIFTHTQHDGRHNVVAGGDVSLRPSDAHSFSATFLASRTERSRRSDLRGNTAQACYTYATRRWFSTNQVEHYDKDFVDGHGVLQPHRFHQRVVVQRSELLSEVASWLQRIHPFYFAKYGRDRIQNGDEDYLHTGIRFNVTRQGFLNFSHGRGHESWKGTKYKVGSDFNFFGNMQALRWLNLGATMAAAPRSSTTRSTRSRAARATTASRRRFNRTSTCPRASNSAATASGGPGPARRLRGEHRQSRTTYQFDKHFLVRMLARYDSSQSRVLTDFLGRTSSCPARCFMPGTGRCMRRDSVGRAAPGAVNPDDPVAI